ncbi:holo-ACP synthase [Christensenellaceae bacterium OttesenSCG-928-K19]|nr:holo-ACP synthase [Christensenellaceae bacterium OttesenSCG-928-K19]
MIVGTGIDITLISRMEQSMKKENFMGKIFTPVERDYIAGKGGHAQTAAGIFCAKEAYLKALGKGIGAISFSSIEILHHESGAPYMQSDVGRVHVSISHMGDIAIAHVIIESED